MGEPVNPQRKPQKPTQASPAPPAPPRAGDASAGELWEDVQRIPRRLKSAEGTPRRKMSGATLVSLAAGLLLIVAAVLAWGLILQQADPPAAAEQAGQSANRPAVAEGTVASSNAPERLDAKTATGPAPAVAANPQAASGPMATAEPKRVTPREAPESAPNQSPEQLAAFTRAMNQAKAALAARDFPRVASALERAQRSAGGANQAQQVKRLRALDRELQRFFEVARAGLKKLEPAAELHYGETIASVVAVGPDTLSLFVERQQQDFTLTTMPLKVALAVAALGGNEESPHGKLLWGALYAVHPQGDRAVARRLWQEAAAQGQEVADLLPLGEGSTLSIDRAEVPAGKPLGMASEQVEKQFASEIAAAKSVQRKAQLAVAMLAVASDAETAAAHYALAEHARGYAVAGGDPKTALAASDALADWFVVDRLSLQSQTLSEALAASKTTAAAKEIASAAIALANRAEKENRLDAAATLAETGYAAARKAHDPQLVKRATALRDEFKQSK